MDMSEVILNLVPKKKNRSKDLFCTRDQVVKLFIAILANWSGMVVYLFTDCCRGVSFAAILYVVTLAENRWKK
jgi:hypothetical protein